MSKQLTIKRAQIIALVICLIIGGGLLAVTVNKYLSAQKVYKVYKQQEARLNELTKEIKETQDSVDRLKKEQDEFRKLLFDERDVPSFLDGISASAAKSYVFVKDMKTQQFTEVALPPKGVPDANGKLARVRITEQDNTPGAQQDLNSTLTLAAMPIHFKIRGTFESIARFINSIENYKQLLTVSNVEITLRNDYPQLNCEFTLRIYSLKQLRDIKP